ncbi:MAG: metallophosphoesterase [Tissierellia bacterium]|nr:metallophosphoesterase [Tissierellia bacterium]
MLVIIFLFFIMVLSIYYSSCLKIERFQIESKVNNPISIVILSDYHSNPSLSLQKLVKRIKNCNPDMIFLLGDITDRHDKDLKCTKLFVKSIWELKVPIFYVLGNHEIDRKDIGKIHHIYKSFGVVHVKDEPYVYEKNGDLIGIYGYDFNGKNNWIELNSKLNLLLTHSYENYKKKENKKFDIIFSGHTHGGQVRIPGIGQLIGHGPTFLPKYSKGYYKLSEKENLYITSGLGNSSIPIRLFNPIEILHIQLKNRL